MLFFKKKFVDIDEIRPMWDAIDLAETRSNIKLGRINRKMPC